MAAENTFAIPSTPIHEDINTAMAGIEKDFLHIEGNNFMPDLDNLQAEYVPISEDLYNNLLLP
jgi:hypothetical protein